MIQSESDKVNFYSAVIPAGFPSPAQDYIEEEIDLNKFLRPRPSATFLVRVEGDSMIDAHIPSGSILVVDKSIKPQHNMIVVGVINGEFTVKRLYKRNGKVMLQPANPKYLPIEISEEMDFKVWGVVTHIIIDTKKL